MTLQARVLAALATVIDPELDEPITTLGFVGSCVARDGGDVDVHLRLPTPQCAPNFAFLMASDAREAVRPAARGRRGRRRARRPLHRRGDQRRVWSGGGTFADAFPGEETGDLDALRALFQRKALLARQGRVCDVLLTAGDGPGRRGGPARRRPPRPVRRPSAA